MIKSSQSTFLFNIPDNPLDAITNLENKEFFRDLIDEGLDIKILKKLMAWGGRYEIPLFMGKENPNLKTGEMLFAEYTKEIERKEKLAKKMPGSASIIQEDIASLKSKRQDMAFIHSVHPEIWTGIKNSPAIGKLSKLIACRVYLLTEYLMPFASKLSNSARDGFPTYTRKDIFELISELLKNTAGRLIQSGVFESKLIGELYYNIRNLPQKKLNRILNSL